MDYADAVERAHDELHEIRSDVEKVLKEDVREGPAAAVLQDVLDFVASAAANAELTKQGPEKSFQSGLALLSAADQRLFMLRNTLEAMKRGDDPRKTVAHYRQLGVLKADEPAAPSAATQAEVAQFQSATAHAAMWGTRQVKRVAGVVSNLMVAAVKAIPKLAKLKMGITFVGGIPCPSFQFEAGSVDWDLGELWDRVSGALRSVPA
jgi:hypothetical protein